MKILSIVFVSWISKITCFYRWSPHDNAEYREEISVDLSRGMRTRRSADDSFHPHTYDLDLKVEESQVHFHLVRNDNIRTNVRTITLSQGMFTDTNLQEEKESIFYQDIKKGASFVVQQDNQSESMFGNFNYGGNSFILKSTEVSLASVISGCNRFELFKEIRNRTEFGDGLQFGSIFEGLQVRQRNRQKRATGSNKVELLIFCDYGIYDYWYRQSEASTTSDKENDALASVRQYYAFVINGMDAMFKNIQTSDYTISVLFAGIVISQRFSEFTFITNGQCRIFQSKECISIDKFKQILNRSITSRVGVPKTGKIVLYDLEYGGLTSHAGLAWTGTICSANSQSIVQDGFDFIIITVAAHGLGHCLGAQHDGVSNVCSGNDAYIMASLTFPQKDPNKASNQWKFSTCSTDYFTSRIDTLESLGERNNCMKTLGSNFDPTALAPYNQSLAAQFYDADAQCVHINGNFSYMCREQYNGTYESICNILWCSNPDGTACQSSIAGEGTLCGNHKWCVSGVCTSDVNAPAGNENCLYGDKRGNVFSNGWTCADMYTNAPNNCEFAQVQCCDTCYPKTTTVTTTIEAHTTSPFKKLTTTDGVTSQGDETIQSTTLTADEFGDLTITALLETHSTIVGDSTVTILCKINGTPPAIAWDWTKTSIDGGNAEIIAQGTNNAKRQVKMSATNPNLNIFSITENDAGIYKCRANNGKRQFMSEHVILDVLEESFRRAPGEPGTVIPLEFQGGTTVILSCSSTGGNPPPLVVWLKDDIVISSGTNTSTSGNVTTTNLTLATTADDDLEVYECQADNGFLQRPLVKTTYLTLNPSNKHPGQPQIIGSHSYELGDIVKLSCSSTGGNPLPTVNWLRDDNIITTGISTSSVNGMITTTLTFTAGLEDHLEVFECKADNGVLQKPLATTTHIELYYEPKFPILTGPTQLISGSSGKWTCYSMNGYPAPTISIRIQDRHYTNEFIVVQSYDIIDRSYTVAGTLNLVPSSDISGQNLCCDVLYYNKVPHSVCLHLTITDKENQTVIIYAVVGSGTALLLFIFIIAILCYRNGRGKQRENITCVKDYDATNPNTQEMHMYDMPQDNDYSHYMTIPADNTYFQPITGNS